ncbi:hypothetical protein DKK74_03760 [Bifidobacterium asteroides]|uniref:Uncharacterized protein n=1 Tax=Bifidobacterium asteroides TaxID=1684 RepID=A0A318MQV5_9BIFI|nr:hypothetical protein DKK74_03760 [Bifidobacterium asteroides]
MVRDFLGGFLEAVLSEARCMDSMLMGSVLGFTFRVHVSDLNKFLQLDGVLLRVLGTIMLVEYEFLKVGPVLFDVQIQLNDIRRLSAMSTSLDLPDLRLKGLGRSVKCFVIHL